MSQVTSILEALKAFEYVMASQLIPYQHKDKIAAEIYKSLPHPFHSTGAVETLAIVQDIMTHSIITDEKTIARTTEDTFGPNASGGAGTPPASQAPKNHKAKKN